MFKFSVKMYQHVKYDVPRMLQTSLIINCLPLWMTWHIYHILISASWWWAAWTFKINNQNLATFEVVNTCERFVFNLHHCHDRLFNNLVILRRYFPTLKKPDANSLQLCCDMDAAHLHLYSDCFFFLTNQTRCM